MIPDSFHFKSVSLDDVKKEVLNLNPKKSSTFGTIPVTILKETIDVNLQHLSNATNHTLAVYDLLHLLNVVNERQ